MDNNLWSQENNSELTSNKADLQNAVISKYEKKTAHQPWESCGDYDYIMITINYNYYMQFLPRSYVWLVSGCGCGPKISIYKSVCLKSIILFFIQ